MDKEIIESETSAIDIARATMYFYSFQEQKEKKELNDLLDPMGLQKRLYFAQMLSLCFFQKSLFQEDFEAWEHGPVIPAVYQEKKYIPSSLNEEYIPSKFEDFIIETNFKVLSTTTSLVLSNISHEENSAWKMFYHPGQRHIKIPKEAILQHPCQGYIKAVELFLENEHKNLENTPRLLPENIMDIFE